MLAFKIERGITQSLGAQFQMNSSSASHMSDTTALMIGIPIVLIVVFLPQIIAKIRGVKMITGHSYGHGDIGVFIWFVQLVYALSTKPTPKNVDEKHPESKGK
jgi:hypothetical protein